MEGAAALRLISSGPPILSAAEIQAVKMYHGESSQIIALFILNARQSHRTIGMHMPNAMTELNTILAEVRTVQRGR